MTVRLRIFCEFTHINLYNTFIVFMQTAHTWNKHAWGEISRVVPKLFVPGFYDVKITHQSSTKYHLYSDKHRRMCVWISAISYLTIPYHCVADSEMRRKKMQCKYILITNNISVIMYHNIFMTKKNANNAKFSMFLKYAIWNVHISI